MNNLKKNFGKKVKYYREKKGFTQEQLAEKLDINCRSLSFIECGTNFVSAETLNKLCRVLEVSPKQLFDFDYFIQNPENTEKALIELISHNKDKLQDFYKILYLYLKL